MNAATIIDTERIRPADLLLTRAQLRRPERAPNLPAEMMAFNDLCLDTGATILVAWPERVFTYLRCTAPAIVEDLIVPLRENAGKPPGTLWIAHHDATARFSAGDARILERLATQLVLTLRLQEQSREHGYAMAVVEAYQLAQRRLLTRELTDERRRRERAEASESKIRQALARKDMAVHEANHRVKNTLQVAASLLSLHARATASAQVRAALEESHGRLRLLAKVHEMLYAGTEGTEEILMPTLLQAMGDALRQSFAEVAGRVKMQVTSEQIVLPPDEAIPIALLANEVMTNAYKHAFPEGSSGMVALDLSGTPQSTIILRIMDNGIGMRPGNGENGLGLKLIRGFAAQLHATLAFDKPEDTEGTVVTLRIQRGAQRAGMSLAGDVDAP